MAVCAEVYKELIERVNRGERPAFEELVEACKKRGFSIAFNMLGNFEDAKDVLQEAFIRVYLNVRGFRGSSQFSTWFYRIVVNCCYDLLRKKQKLAKVFSNVSFGSEGGQMEPDIPDTSNDPAKNAIISELSGHLDDCISRLSKKQRTCFVLKHREGLKIEEIAQVAKCSPATVKVHIFRAIDNLRKSLCKYNLK